MRQVVKCPKGQRESSRELYTTQTPPVALYAPRNIIQHRTQWTPATNNLMTKSEKHSVEKTPRGIILFTKFKTAVKHYSVGMHMWALGWLKSEIWGPGRLGQGDRGKVRRPIWMQWACNWTYVQPARLLCPWNFPGKDTGVEAIPFSRGPPQTADQIHISCISCFGRWILTAETPEKPFVTDTHLQTFFKNFLIYLAMLSLSCCMQELVIVARGLSCSAACGIWFLDQGSNHISCMARRILNPWPTREAPSILLYMSHMSY